MIRFPRRMTLGAALGVMAGLLSTGAVRAETHRDPRAMAVVDAVEKAIAPEEAWSKVGGLRFTFSVIKDGSMVAEVHHLWDVRSGLCRVDWKGKQGEERLAMFNVSAKGKVGEAYMKVDRGKPELPPPDAPEASSAVPTQRSLASPASWARPPAPIERKVLEAGYGRFINDTYWLLMPLKMKDPGVNLDYDGEKKIDEQTYDVLKLTFDHVGLTPGDTYWVYVNRDTHLIDRWEYILEDEAAGKDARKDDANKEGEKDGKAAESTNEAAAKAPERTLWIWKEWKTCGPVKLATVKSMQDGSTSIVLKDIEVMPSVDAAEFKSPMKPAPHAGGAGKPKKG